MILDEPTSVLTPQESEALFVILDQLKAEGRALLYISHRLDDVRRLCDRATILRGRQGRGHLRSASRDGPLHGGPDGRGADRRGDGARRHARATSASPPSACRCRPRASTPRRCATSTSRSGPARCWASRASPATGRTSSSRRCRASGWRPRPEQIRIDGAPAGREGVTARRRRGAAFVPEERNGHAAVPGFALSDNLVLSRHATGEVSRGGFLLSRVAAAHLARRHRDASTCASARPIPPPGRCRAATCRNSSSGARSCASPACWSSTSRPGASTRWRRRPSTRPSSISRRGARPSWSSRRTSTSCFSLCDRLCVIHAGTLSPATPTAETDRDDVGLRMAGTAAAGPAAHAH